MPTPLRRRNVLIESEQMWPLHRTANRQPAFAREPDRGFHVRGSCRFDDCCRPASATSVNSIHRLQQV